MISRRAWIIVRQRVLKPKLTKLSTSLEPSRYRSINYSNSVYVRRIFRSDAFCYRLSHGSTSIFLVLPWAITTKNDFCTTLPWAYSSITINSVFDVKEKECHEEERYNKAPTMGAKPIVKLVIYSVREWA